MKAWMLGLLIAAVPASGAWAGGPAEEGDEKPAVSERKGRRGELREERKERRGELREERKERRGEFRKEIKAFRQEQKQKREAFKKEMDAKREALAGKLQGLDAKECRAVRKKGMLELREERKRFREEMDAGREAFIEAHPKAARIFEDQKKKQQKKGKNARPKRGKKMNEALRCGKEKKGPPEAEEDD